MKIWRGGSCAYSMLIQSGVIASHRGGCINGILNHQESQPSCTHHVSPQPLALTYSVHPHGIRMVRPRSCSRPWGPRGNPVPPILLSSYLCRCPPAPRAIVPCPSLEPSAQTLGDDVRQTVYISFFGLWEMFFNLALIIFICSVPLGRISGLEKIIWFWLAAQTGVYRHVQPWGVEKSNPFNLEPGLFLLFK